MMGEDTYTVKNTVKEVPKGIFEQMLNDGLITRPEYNKLIKNKKIGEILLWRKVGKFQ